MEREINVSGKVTEKAENLFFPFFHQCHFSETTETFLVYQPLTRNEVSSILGITYRKQTILLSSHYLLDFIYLKLV